jgi:hypothetical protein
MPFTKKRRDRGVADIFTSIITSTHDVFQLAFPFFPLLFTQTLPSLNKREMNENGWKR